MWFPFNYATPSVFEADSERALVGLSAESRRPVRFAGQIRANLLMIRFALRALGEVVWRHFGAGCNFAVLDPAVTVHPDGIFLEAFSADQSAYARVQLDLGNFELEGEPVWGTTNIDFTSWLWAAMGELRTSRETTFRIEPAGFEVATQSAGGRFESSVEVPETWLRAYLELSAAMMLPGTRFTARPVDLLGAVRYLRHSKARVSPRALRYEFEPDQPVRLVLEPWERVFELRGSEHAYPELHRVRTWGRQRLAIVEPLLPFAEGVDIYLKGRSLPSFYVVRLPGVRFLLGLTGHSGQGFSEEARYSLMAPREKVDPERVLQHLERERLLPDDGSRELEELVRRGQAVYELELRAFRHRPLTAQPIPEGPPDERWEKARALRVSITRCEPQETRKVKRLKTPEGAVNREVVYRDWRLAGEAEGQSPDIVLGESGRIVFGTCTCAFFRENLMHAGPCEHMLALLRESASLTEGESSVPAEEGPPKLEIEGEDPQEDEAEEG